MNVSSPGGGEGVGGGGGGSGRKALVLVPNYYGLVRVLPISTPRALHQSLQFLRLLTVLLEPRAKGPHFSLCLKRRDNRTL